MKNCNWIWPHSIMVLWVWECDDVESFPFIIIACRMPVHKLTRLEMIYEHVAIKVRYDFRREWEKLKSKEKLKISLIQKQFFTFCEEARKVLEGKLFFTFALVTIFIKSC